MEGITQRISVITIKVKSLHFPIKIYYHIQLGKIQLYVKKNHS